MSDSEDGSASLIGDVEEDPISSPIDEEENEVDEAEQENSETLYIMYNKQMYKLEKVKPETASEPGWTRCYHRPHQVADGKTLGLLAKGSEEEWAPLEKVSVDKIVVCQARMRPDDPTLYYVWYLLFEVANSEGKNDYQILRHIPKKTYKAIHSALKEDEQMSESKLLKQPAYLDNVKPIDPTKNNLVKCAKGEEPKTAAIEPPKPQSAKKAAQINAEGEARPVKKSKHADGASKPIPAKKALGPKKDDAEPPPAVPSSPIKASEASFFVPKPGNNGKKPVATEEPEPEPAPAATSNTKQTMNSVVVQSSFLICDAKTDVVSLKIPAGLKPTGGEVTVKYTFN